MILQHFTFHDSIEFGHIIPFLSDNGRNTSLDHISIYQFIFKIYHLQLKFTPERKDVLDLEISKQMIMVYATFQSHTDEVGFCFLLLN